MLENITELIPTIKTEFGLVYKSENPKHKNRKKKPLTVVYLAGSTEKESTFFPGNPTYANVGIVIKNAYNMAVELKRFEKQLKLPEVARIKGEIRAIKELLDKTRDEQKRRQLIEDYEKLSEQLVDLVPEDKKAIRKLKLEIKTVPTEKRKEHQEKIEKLKKSLKKNKNDQNELTLKQIERKEEKKLIKELRAAKVKVGAMGIKYGFKKAVNYLKEGFLNSVNSAFGNKEEL
ncbi:hypothetical protein TRFO_41291 [Tritrichomonas foetus]|uniref:Uncharacterized protein n=1 Tax=Tritrichomonas foetus TaxID=1144522 RepID=A0A1J4L583_9EUKA|nr:hypothetical protein TRFO_41291 [Tritrichomonas foetus]|eukprot:OHT17094.1 hypothetical protein TRFO_41291 [Tritrichomonas foetus]